MAGRGRPRKNPIEDAQEVEMEEFNNSDTDEGNQPRSVGDIMNDGTFNDYNPFSENVVERDYATPKTASGVVEEIEEPSFIPPSYEDIIQERNQQQENDYAENNPSPFENPNPAMNDLDDKEKRIACESLVDTILDGYEQAHRYAQYVVKVDEEELYQKQAEGKIDLSMQIPVSDTETMSVAEFIGQYNQQSETALKYDKEFGYKVRPAMVRVFMKRGWGMTDEQYLIYMFGKDIAVKVGIIYSLKKTINSTMATFEKATKRNNMGASNVDVYETTTSRQEMYEEDDMADEDTYEVQEEQEVQEKFTSGMNINMPQNPQDPMAGHPSEIRNQLRKEKKSKE